MTETTLSDRTCTLYVCTSCRMAGTPAGPTEKRSGFKLYRQLRKAVQDSPFNRRVEVKPAGCLSICPRPCGIALSMSGSWTYLFGDQQPDKAAKDVMECVRLYLKSVDGFIARDSRPESLRRSILGRVPPIQNVRLCT